MRNIIYWSNGVDPSVGSWLDGKYDPSTGGVLKPNGKYLSVDTHGDYTESDSIKGSWERFRLADSLNALLVTPDLVTYPILVKQN